MDAEVCQNPRGLALPSNLKTRKMKTDLEPISKMALGGEKHDFLARP